MATVTGSLSAVDDLSDPITVNAGETLTVTLSGTYVGTCMLQQSEGGGAQWEDFERFSVGTEAITTEGTYRLRCTQISSGVADYSLVTNSPVGVLIASTKLITTADADVTGVNGTDPQSIFPAGQDAFLALANQAYLFELFMSVMNGATPCTKALAFGGTATLASLRYWVQGQHVAVNTEGATQSSTHVDTADPTVVLASGATPWFLAARGILRTNAAGTIIPQFAYSADPTGAILIKKDSYMWLQPIGVGAVASVGAWS